jgi:hypothetical protein
MDFIETQNSVDEVSKNSQNLSNRDNTMVNIEHFDVIEMSQTVADFNLRSQVPHNLNNWDISECIRMRSIEEVNNENSKLAISKIQNTVEKEIQISDSLGVIDKNKQIVPKVITESFSSVKAQTVTSAEQSQRMEKECIADESRESEIANQMIENAQTKKMEVLESNIAEINGNSKPTQAYINITKKMLEIKRLLLTMNKEHGVTYIKLKKQLIGMFNILKQLSFLNHQFTDKNQLSSSFLKLFIKIFECPTLNNNKLHEVFKLVINCYILNFENFTKADKFQYNLLFQLIFDLIKLNSTKIKNTLGKSYLLRFASHKIKNQLTTIKNGNHLQILLYYLIQLLFLTIKSKFAKVKFAEKQFFFENCRKLMAFLIVNGNAELLKIFHLSRKQLLDQERIKKQEKC